MNANTDATFLQYRQGEQVVSRSYAEVAEAVDRLAIELAQSGCSKGETIALLGENSCEWIVTYLAILQAGCVVVPIDSLMPLPEILQIVDVSQARLFFCSERFANLIAESPVQPKVPVVELGQDLAYASPVSPLKDQSGQLPTDVAVIIFTSGTTGHSKGVVLSHENLVANIVACNEVCGITRTDNFLLLLPLHHTFASTVSLLLPMAVGARVTLATSYRSRDIVEDIRISGVTILVGVPQLFENMMLGILRAVASTAALKRAIFHALRVVSHSSMRIGLKVGGFLFKPLRQKAGLSSIRLMVSGGAALPTSVNRFFETIGLVLIQGYGLTECSPVLTVNPPAKNKLGSVGQVLQGVSLRIDNPNEAGVGEVTANGPNIMQGYYKNNEATQLVLKDGWLRTGDAGFLDREGYLYLTGRIKNVIVTSAGKNIYPEELETRLIAEPAILDALVLGVCRKGQKDERLCALLKLDKEYLKSQSDHRPHREIAAELVHNYNHGSPSFQKIREWQLLDGEFEKTSIGKIKRFHYKDHFQ